MILNSKLAAVILSGVLLTGCSHKGKPEDLDLGPTTEGVKIEDRVNQLSEQFGVEIPQEADRIILESTDGSPKSALATKENHTITILANLPDENTTYTARAVNLKDSQIIQLGELRLAKGGWILDREIDVDPSGYTIEVLKENAIILKGSFK